MKRRTLALWVVLLVIGALAVQFIMPAPLAAEKPQVYKVGFISHLTGDAAVYGQSLKMGTELAVDVINEAGGINGVPVEVIYEDDRLSAADAQTAFL